MGTSDDTVSSTSYEKGTTKKTGGTRQELENTYQTQYKSNDYERLVVMTSNMWTQRPMVYAFEPIPESVLTDIITKYQEPYDNRVVEQICSLMEKRKDDTNENYWQHPFNKKLTPDKLISHFASAALLSGVNRAFYTPSSNTIYCYLGNCNFIQVNLNEAADVTMPGLDLDDGIDFRYADSHEEEWEITFNNWLQAGRKENYIFKFNPNGIVEIPRSKKQKTCNRASEE